MKSYKTTIVAVFLTVSLLLSSCSRVAEQVVPVDKPIGQTDPETGLPLYFSSVDEAITPYVQQQQGGTCWAYAAVTAMDYTHKYQTGEGVDIDPVDLTLAIFDPDREDTIILDDDVAPEDAGGNSNLVMGYLSGGYENYILTECVEYEDADMTDMKEAIMEYGAMTANVSIYPTHFQDTRGTRTFIADAYSGSNHDVVLVGWNDNFPADAFAVEASQNGAWLAQNSYSDSWGDHGFFWISYDTPFTQLSTYVISEEYSDSLTLGNCYSTWMSLDNVVANHYSESGSLSAIGIYLYEPDSDISVTVYNDDFSEELYTYSGHYDLSGYYTIELEEELEVDGFAIAVDFGGTVICEGRTFYRDDRYYQSTCEEGQSFILANNEWIDVTESDRLRTLRIYDPVNNFFIVALMK